MYKLGIDWAVLMRVLHVMLGGCPDMRYLHHTHVTTCDREDRCIKSNSSRSGDMEDRYTAKIYSNRGDDHPDVARLL